MPNDRLMRLGASERPIRRVVISRDNNGGLPSKDSWVNDVVLIEEPLEIRLDGDVLAVTMRTPTGHDRQLALGFLFAEGIIESTEDVSSVSYCGRTGDTQRENTIDVRLIAGRGRYRDRDAAYADRGAINTINSSCGVCGRKSIDDLLARCESAVQSQRQDSSASIRESGESSAIALGDVNDLVERLRKQQTLFSDTGGCHAAGLATRQGDYLYVFEDVGRHNAVDKVIGAAFLEQKIPLTDHYLVVSGRVSFEIVQKAIVAGVRAIFAVSAASTLAVDLAQRAGVGLIGFVRPGGFVIYSECR